MCPIDALSARRGRGNIDTFLGNTMNTGQVLSERFQHGAWSENSQANFGIAMMHDIVMQTMALVKTSEKCFQ